MPFRLLTPRSLRVTWRLPLSTGNIVWKLVPAKGGRIVVEERDPAKFESRLRAIYVRTGEELWNAPSPIDPWWTNLTGASGDRAILEGYASRDLPISKGVAALDLASGKLAWMDRDIQLLEIGSSSMRVRSTEFGIEKICWRSLKDGGPSEDRDRRDESVDTVYPEELAPADSLHELEGVTTIGPVESAGLREYRVYSYHLPNDRDPANLMQQTYRCELAVWRGPRRVLHETLAARSPFPVAGNFVILHDTLIYVQEKSSLVGVHLT